MNITKNNSLMEFSLLFWGNFKETEQVSQDLKTFRGLNLWENQIICLVCELSMAVLCRMVSRVKHILKHKLDFDKNVYA